MGHHPRHPAFVDVVARRSGESLLGGVVVTASGGANRVTIRVHGELDTMGTARLESVCADRACRAGQSVVLDLEGVTFASSTAVAYLGRLQADLDAGGVRLVIRPSEHVRRLLDIVEQPA